MKRFVALSNRSSLHQRDALRASLVPSRPDEPVAARQRQDDSCYAAGCIITGAPDVPWRLDDGVKDRPRGMKLPELVSKQFRRTFRSSYFVPGRML